MAKERRKIAAADLLPIYRRNLKRYESEGDPRAEVQRRLVASLQRRADREAASPKKR